MVLLHNGASQPFQPRTNRFQETPNCRFDQGRPKLSVQNVMVNMHDRQEVCQVISINHIFPPPPTHFQMNTQDKF